VKARQRLSVLRKIAARRAPSDAATPPLWIMSLDRKGSAVQSCDRAKLGVLTRRELEILRYVATGETDRAIADSLFLSHRTVSNHVSRILRKLDAPSRRAAVRTAMRVGML
jgi:DNA-binding NarL/FixJ family response regulator